VVGVSIVAPATSQRAGEDRSEALDARRSSAYWSEARFRPDIEGLRAVAVIAVLAFHARVPGFTGGYVGVDVFFVLSGFLITGLMIRDVQTDRGMGFATFYARRARRLLPASTVVILFTLVGSALVLSPLEQARVASDARASALFFSNIRFASQATDYFQADLAPSPFQHFWSLSVEEQFYFLWPAVFLAAPALLRRLCGWGRIASLAAGTSVILVASLATSVWLVPANQPGAFFWLQSRAWELMVGALAAVAIGPIVRRVPSRVGPLLVVAGLVLIGATVVMYDESTPFPGLMALPPVLGSACVVVGGGIRPDSSAARGLGTPVMRRIGQYSYSLYLWHWPVLVLAAAAAPTVASRWPRALAVTLLVATPLAVVSYHLVEHPLRSSRWLAASPRRGLTMAGALIAVSIAASVVYGLVAHGGPLHAGRAAPVLGARDAAPALATDYVPSNLSPGLDEAATSYQDCADPDACVGGAPSGEILLEVFGDSHAKMWTEGFAALAERDGWRVRRTAEVGCPSFLYEPTGDPVVDCDRYRDATFARLADDPPPVVVLANHSVGAYRRDASTWEQAVRDAIRRLPDASQVLVFAQSPDFTREVPTCLAQHLDDTAACESARRGQLREMNDRLEEIVVEEGATFVDIEAWLCDDARCPVIAGNALLYRDKSHLTPEFVRSRIDLLEGSLAPHLP
jgi:peptidoglycan/LPS O-acetylase OafA/YrhL